MRHKSHSNLHRQGNLFYFRHWVGPLQLKVSLRTRDYDEAAALASLLRYHRDMTNTTDDYDLLRDHLKDVYSQLVTYHKQQISGADFKLASTWEFTRNVPDHLLGPVMTQLEDLHQRAEAAVQDDLLGVSTDSLAKVELPEPKGMLLSALFEAVEKDKLATGTWGKHTQRQCASLIRRFIREVGDLPIEQYTKTTIRTWRDGLDMKPKSRNTAMAQLTGVFSWAISNELLDKNPASGLKITEGKDNRRAFTPVEVMQILEHTAEGNGWRHDSAMIAAYSGMRVGEICQLTSDDIIEVDGVQCFDLRDKKVKSKASERLVPIHPKLQYLTERSGPLVGVHRSTVGSWFSATLKLDLSLGSDVVFHSFRRSVANAMLQTGVDEERCAAILGHTYGKSLSFKLYADAGHNMKQLHEAMVLLNY